MKRSRDVPPSNCQESSGGFCVFVWYLLFTLFVEYIYIYIYIYIHTPIYIYIYIHTPTYTYIYIYIYIHTYTYYISLSLYIYIYIYIYIYTHVYVYIIICSGGCCSRAAASRAFCSSWFTLLIVCRLLFVCSTDICVYIHICTYLFMFIIFMGHRRVAIYRLCCCFLLGPLRPRAGAGPRAGFSGLAYLYSCCCGIMFMFMGLLMFIPYYQIMFMGCCGPRAGAAVPEHDAAARDVLA